MRTGCATRRRSISRPPEEMRALFAEMPGACDATLEIAERCNVEDQARFHHIEKYPQFGTPDGSPREEYLMQLCREGLVKTLRPGTRANDEALQRAPEIRGGACINQTRTSPATSSSPRISSSGRATTTSRSARAAARRRVRSSPMPWASPTSARCASACSSNASSTPNASARPTSISTSARAAAPEVIEYVRQKYGERSVSHIITYGTMGAKSVIRDVARVMGWSYGDADRIAKMIPSEAGHRRSKRRVTKRSPS